MNWTKKTVYQTLEDRGNSIQVELEGPYPCNWENTWLGEGYYFWDTFIENAHWWGKEVRKNYLAYIICRAECDFNDIDCLDLHGNTEQLKMFKDSYELSKSMGKVNETTTVKMFLAFLKGENKAFKYEAIRVNGIRSKSINSEYSVNLMFEDRKTQYLEIIPAVQICFFDKTSLNLRNYKIIYPENYVTGYLV